LFVSLADEIVTVTAYVIFSYNFTKHERISIQQNNQLLHSIRVVLQANKHTYIHM